MSLENFLAFLTSDVKNTIKNINNESVTRDDS